MAIPSHRPNPTHPPTHRASTLLSQSLPTPPRFHSARLNPTIPRCFLSTQPNAAHSAALPRQTPSPPSPATLPLHSTKPCPVTSLPAHRPSPAQSAARSLHSTKPRPTHRASAPQADPALPTALPPLRPSPAPTTALPPCRLRPPSPHCSGSSQSILFLPSSSPPYAVASPPRFSPTFHLPLTTPLALALTFSPALTLTPGTLRRAPPQPRPSPLPVTVPCPAFRPHRLPSQPGL